MSLPNEHSDWLNAGMQRAAVARVLRKPMTASEICAVARAYAPRLQLRDVWFLMRQMAARRLAKPLNRRSNNGRLYTLTRTGVQAVNAAFGLDLHVPSASVDWQRYAWVVRARIRRRVLLGLAQMDQRNPEGHTASSIRKFIHNDYPVGLNPVLRAVRELAAQELIISVGVTKLRSCKLFRLTPSGRAIVEQLQR